MEKQFLLAGPRNLAIELAQKLFDDKLKGFAGQRFRTSMCALDVYDLHVGMGLPSDVAVTEGAIGMALSHAGWIAVASSPTSSGFIPLTVRGCSNNSVLVAVRADAPPQAHAAAQALSDVLRGVISQSRSAHAGVGPMPDIDSSNQLPADVIEIRIGRHLFPHMTFDSSGSSRRPNRNRPTAGRLLEQKSKVAHYQSCYAFVSTALAAALHRQHGYRVRFNDNPQYPQILEIVEEVPLPKPA